MVQLFFGKSLFKYIENIMKKETTIDISQDFSAFPAGRYRQHGDYTGEVFREDILVPKMKEFSVVKIIFDGIHGNCSSFLEEAFGGLIRNTEFSVEDINQNLHFISDRKPSIIKEVKEYIQEASVR